MATPNADITRYDSGSATDQDARVRRDERIRLVAERDRVMRDLQQLRGSVAMEVRGVETLNRKDTAGTLAKSQTTLVALERRLLQLEQALAATPPEAAPIQQAESELAGELSPATMEASQQQSTTDIRRAAPARQLAGGAPATRRPNSSSASSVSPEAGVQRSTGAEEIQKNVARLGSLRKAATQTQVIAQKKLQLAQAVYQRSSKERANERASILGDIQKTPFLIVGFALYTALVCDLLSIVDLGWLVSWAIPIISWFMVRRINGIMKSSSRIVESTKRLSRKSVLLRQRIVPMLPVAERAKFLATERIGQLSGAASSYISTWVRDSVITQLLELIPFVDWLPLYLGQVVKMIINQNVEHQKVKKLMPSYERALAVVDKLERLEINQLNRRFALVMRQQNAEALQFREELTRPAPDTAVQPRPARLPARPVRDIGQPGSGVAPAPRPTQQQPRRNATIPMRDVAVAA